MLWLVSSIRGIEPDQELARLQQLLVRRAVTAEGPDLGVDRRDRALDVVRIDAGANHSGPGPTLASNELNA